MTEHMQITGRSEMQALADGGLDDVWLPVLLMLSLLLLAYLGMWHGWRKRAHRHRMPELVPVPDDTEHLLEADAHYLGTTVSGDWLDRIVAHNLGTRSKCRICLSAEGLDMVRPFDTFRIPLEALREARHDQGIAGKVVPPHGLLVVTWTHGDYVLDTGVRLDGNSDHGGDDASRTAIHNHWIDAIEQLIKEQR